MSSRTLALARAFRPPSALAGRLATQSLLFALGEGTFMTGSAVFFTQIVGLSAAQVGLGLTIAGVAAFIAALPAGRMVDRYGPKRMWALSATGQAGLFAFWPFIDTFSGYVAMAVAMEVVGSLGGAAHGAYTIDALPPDERVKSRAYMYSALNVGFTLGSLVGGIALAFDSNVVLNALPWFTSCVFLVNGVAILRLPNASHDERTPEQRKERLPGPGPLRNPGWLATTFFGGVLWTNQVLLNIVIPLWLVEETDAPRVLLAFLFGTNTVMCIFLPMAAARGIKDVTTRCARSASRRALRALLPDHPRHPRHHRLGDHRAGVARPRDRDRCGALPVGGQLVLRGRADGPTSPRRVPGRGRVQRHPRPGLGAGALHVPGDELGCRRLAAHRRDRDGCRHRHAPGEPDGTAVPGAEGLDPHDFAQPEERSSVIPLRRCWRNRPSPGRATASGLRRPTLTC